MAQAGGGTGTTPQARQRLHALKPGEPVERELAGDASHNYRVSLASAQYVHFIVEQKGIDVVVVLYGPDGKKLVEVDSPNGTNGPEPLAYVTEAAGEYRLEIRSLEKNAPAGRYEVRIEDLRAATEKDKSQIAAQEAFKEAIQLAAQQTKDSYERAIEKYQRALRLWRAAGDVTQEAFTLNNIAQIYYLLGDKKKTLELSAQSLSIMQSTGNQYGEATLLSNMAAAYDDLGERQTALDFYNKALPLRRAAGDKSGEAITLSNIGYLYKSLNEYQRALEYFNQALAIARAIKDRSSEAAILSNAGAVYRELGEMQKALDYHNQALAIKQALGDRMGESNVLNDLGNFYFNLGDTQKALAHYNKSLSLARELGDRSGEASSLGNVALCYDTMGDKQKALEFYARALELAHGINDKSEPTIIFGIGSVYNSLDENEQALDYFNRALPLLKAIGDRSGEAAVLNNIGIVYDRLSDGQKALEFYGQALTLFKAIGERRAEAILLDNIGAVYKSLDDDKRALDYHNQAVALGRTIGDKSTLATALRNIGIIHRSAGDYSKASEYLNEALANGKAVGNPRLIGSALNNLAETYLLSGDAKAALDTYNQGLRLWQTAGDQTGQAGAYYGLARAHRALGDLNQARLQIEEALRLVESLRNRLSRRQLQLSYFSAVQKYYEFYIELLMRLHQLRPQEGNDATALRASERQRARGLLDMLAEARAEIREGVDPVLLSRERSLQQSINARAEEQIKLLNVKHTASEAADVSKDIESLTTQLEDVETQIRTTSPRYAALTQPLPLTLTEIQQQVLDDHTLLLEYALGEERSYLWVASKVGLTSYELPKRGEIEKVARELYALMTTPNQQMKAAEGNRGLRVARVASDGGPLQEAIGRLSRIVLAPAASQLGTKRLLIVADGALQYVPFAALSAKAPAYRPLIIDHEVITLPSASTLAVLRQEHRGRKPADRTLAVLADPVFEATDERLMKAKVEKKSPGSIAQRGLTLKKAAMETGVTREGLEIPRLPGTRREAERILALTPAAERIGAVDFAANKAMATSDDIGRYRFVHFATHGFLDSVRPDLSGIVLSLVDERGAPQDGFLRAHEIFNLKLPAELVVLSACQTGLGKEVRGEGLVGITRGFMYAGAARVVVSLWSVDDEATSELMTSFYSRMIQDHQSPASALRAAQIEMLKHPGWQAPYYWAAFVLQGEWK
jgi:CHAT domain-containing protein/Flp pilus assembly protein TadD